MDSGGGVRKKKGRPRKGKASGGKRPAKSRNKGSPNTSPSSDTESTKTTFNLSRQKPSRASVSNTTDNMTTTARTSTTTENTPITQTTTGTKEILFNSKEGLQKLVVNCTCNVLLGGTVVMDQPNTSTPTGDQSPRVAIPQFAETQRCGAEPAQANDQPIILDKKPKKIRVTVTSTIELDPEESREEDVMPHFLGGSTPTPTATSKDTPLTPGTTNTTTNSSGEDSDDTLFGVVSLMKGLEEFPILGQQQDDKPSKPLPRPPKKKPVKKAKAKSEMKSLKSKNKKNKKKKSDSSSTNTDTN